MLVHLKDKTAGVAGDVLILPVDPMASAAEIESVLYGRSDDSAISSVDGPWVAVVDTGEGRRLYVGATHSAVFSPSARAAAASHNLIPNLNRDLELSREVDPLARNGYYAYGLTAFRGLHRLLPNHVLDLDRFESNRFWPAEAWPLLDDGPEAAAAAVDHGRRLVAGLIGAGHRLELSLSAGRDSRAILAILRPLIESGQAEVQIATSYGKDLESRTDRQAAVRLARIAGCPITLTRRIPHRADSSHARKMFVRIGEAYAGPILSARKLLETEQVAGAGEGVDWVLPGMAGETGRSYFWKWRAEDESVTVERLVREIGCGDGPAVREAAARWLSEIPESVQDRPPDVWDLAYVEHRLGGWHAPSCYLFPGRMRTFNLLASSGIIHRMLRLPIDYRRRRQVQDDMVAYGWPALMAVPFNQPTGLLDLQRRIQNRLGKRR